MGNRLIYTRYRNAWNIIWSLWIDFRWIKGKEATNANKDIVVEEQITAKDVNSKKKQISLLNIVFSSLMLLAFLIFGFSEFYEISNLGYFSLYDILFS